MNDILGAIITMIRVLVLISIVFVPLGLWKTYDLVFVDAVTISSKSEAIQEIEDGLNKKYAKGYSYKTFLCHDVVSAGPPPAARNRTEEETIVSWNKFVEKRKVDFLASRNSEMFRIVKQ